jgi:hypothetical protein
MKRSIIILLLATPQILLAQQIDFPKLSPELSSLRPLHLYYDEYLNRKVKVYLNSIEINFDSTFINGKNIKSINVRRHSEPPEIFISTKKQPLKFKNLDDILLEEESYIKLLSDSVKNQIIFINGRLVNNRSDIKIDDSFKPKIFIIYSNNNNNLDITKEKTAVINIWTSKEEYKRSKNPDTSIRLRGY